MPRRFGSNKQNFCYPFSDENPDQTDVVCDDVVLLTLQYSSQWDSFAHVGSRFDADGDGKAEIVFYNGYRAGEHIVPASERSPKPGTDTRAPKRARSASRTSPSTARKAAA